jgi:hypothetical protein
MAAGIVRTIVPRRTPVVRRRPMRAFRWDGGTTRSRVATAMTASTAASLNGRVVLRLTQPHRPRKEDRRRYWAGTNTRGHRVRLPSAPAWSPRRRNHGDVLHRRSIEVVGKPRRGGTLGICVPNGGKAVRVHALAGIVARYGCRLDLRATGGIIAQKGTPLGEEDGGGIVRCCIKLGTIADPKPVHRRAGHRSLLH